MRIFLCRHGETTGDVEDRYGGDYDDHLTAKGKKQAAGLAEKLDGFGIEVVFTSPLLRAVETAGVISKKLGVKIVAVGDLRERNHYGVLTGLIKSEAKAKHPKEVEELARDKLHHKVAGSEDYASLTKRVLGAFTKIAESKEYEVVCAISHGGAIKCIVRELGLGEINHLEDCAILEIEANEGKFGMVAVDGVEFGPALRR